MKILFISPHPDDEVLGCGGTIIKNVSQGNEVYLCIMTKGDEAYYGAEVLEEKRKEALKAAEFLGIRGVFFCNFTATKLSETPLNQIINKLKNIFTECQPEIIFVPHYEDLHQDHKITFQCAMVAARPCLKQTIKKILAYETISETEWSSPFHNKFIPQVYVDISQELAKKIETLSLYRTELKEYPHPRSLKGLEIKSRQRGNEVCLEAAEAFMLIREKA